MSGINLFFRNNGFSVFRIWEENARVGRCYVPFNHKGHHEGVEGAEIFFDADDADGADWRGFLKTWKVLETFQVSGVSNGKNVKDWNIW